MRAYKFLDAHFGLKSLYERRLKPSRISDLNDPFELVPYDLTDPVFRQTFLQTRDQMDEDRGVHLRGQLREAKANPSIGVLCSKASSQ